MFVKATNLLYLLKAVINLGERRRLVEDSEDGTAKNKEKQERKAKKLAKIEEEEEELLQLPTVFDFFDFFHESLSMNCLLSIMIFSECF